MNFPTRFFTDLLLFLGILPVGLAAEDHVCLPRPQRGKYLYDYSRILTREEARSLSSYLEILYNKNLQVAVIITDNLCGMEISMYANEIGERWGVGVEGYDNGVVIVVKPKRRENQKGEIFIAPGRGAQDVLPDAVVYDIVHARMIPYFKDANYYEGIKVALRWIEKIVLENQNYAMVIKERKSSISFRVSVVMLFIIFLSLVINIPPIVVFTVIGMGILIQIILLVIFPVEHNLKTAFFFSMAYVILGYQRLKNRTHFIGRESRARRSSGRGGGFGGGRFNGGGAGDSW